MHWWVAAMALLYALSGISVIQADEVAVVLRWGRLLGDTPALQQHGPGLLFALPRPIDEVVRVKARHVAQLPIETLSAGLAFAELLDPLTVGYALTGDQNVVHVAMVARYRIRDPADWAFYGPPAEEILRVEVTAAMMRSLGEKGVDVVLSEGREALVAAATRRAQAGLDAAHAGLALVSLELIELRPPRALAADFEAVQSAFIEATTNRKNAQAYALDVVPSAQAAANAAAQAARAGAAAARARARGEAEAFLALAARVRADPKVVRVRLYRDAVERAFGNARSVRWVPPPVDGRYHGMRVQIFEDDSGPAASALPGIEP
jgi:membrane protease subunit HflK